MIKLYKEFVFCSDICIEHFSSCAKNNFLPKSIYKHTYMYIYIYVCVYIYIYIYVLGKQRGNWQIDSVNTFIQSRKQFSWTTGCGAFQFIGTFHF